MTTKNALAFLPAVTWLRHYQPHFFVQDLTAAIIVTVLLIPQSLAYAMLAGVPPEVGLYASVLPLAVYALLGSSRTLSVGPVAVISLMTATSLGNVAAGDSAAYLAGAMVLALLSGLFLLLMGIFKLGFISNFLSHPVISGFISASGIIIALSQLKHLLGIQAGGDTLLELLPSLWRSATASNLVTVLIGGAVLLFLFWSKRYAAKLLRSLGLSQRTAVNIAKTAPILGVFASILAVFALGLERQGVALTGAFPAGLPQLTFFIPSLAMVKTLALPALLIAIIGYVESISVGKTLAAKRQQKLDPNQELVGLGAANIASAFSGAFPVTGGFSRSVVNFDAGAATQAASLMTAAGIALASMFLTPVLAYLPKATLAATIVVAVVSLIDFSILPKTWVFSKSDFFAVLVTILVTLVFGVEAGVACGVGASIALYLYRTSKPHIAEVGLIEGTEHFRNVRRYHVQTLPEILMLRPDASLFFANAGFLEDTIVDALYRRDNIAHVILQCTAVNEIDFSALEMLEALNQRLMDQGVLLHLSEVKGPVMDSLARSGLLQHLSGKVFLTQFEAFNEVKQSLTPVT